MVYNVGGGNKSKGLARKFVVQSHAIGNSKTVRVAKEIGEQYAVVQKHLGNCMCMVVCSDGYRRLCIIRKKFTGRRKTDNNISSGSVVLIGLRDYSSSSSSSSSSINESVSGKDTKRCDLLYVYSDQEKEKLRKLCDLSKLSSSLEDSSQRNASAEHEPEDIMFVTSGTGVFNKYTKDESRHKGAVITPLTAHHHASNSGSKNVISNRDWLDSMNMPSDDDGDDDDDDDDDDDEEEEEEEVDSDDSDEAEYKTHTNKSAVAIKKDVKKDIIDIDDI
jgi:translation initiation factor IF-1